jgi:hypothetical protein
MPVGEGDVVRVAAHMTWSGNDLINVYHVRAATTVDVPNVQFSIDVAGWLEDAYGEIITRMSDGVDFVEIRWRNLTADEPVVIAQWPTLTSGSGSNDALPLQCAYLVSFPTDTVRRTARKFIPGPIEDHVSLGGTVNEATKADLLNYGAEILAGFYTGNAVAIPGTYNEDTLVFAALISLRVDGLVRTQRRRVKNIGS